MTLPTNYVDGQTIHGTDVNTWTTAINAATNLRPGMLAPCQGLVNGETLTISGGSVTQITGLTTNGYTPSIGDRILILCAPATTGASTAFTATLHPANGIYVVTGNTTNLTVARSSDMSGSQNPAGMCVLVETATWPGNGCVFWVTNPNGSAAFTWGTTNNQWFQAGGPGGNWATISLGSGAPFMYVYNGSGETTLSAAASVGAQALTFPATATSDTLVGRNSTDILTNKTLTDPILSGDASPTYSSGKLVFDTANDCLTFFNSDSNVSLQIGQEQWLRVVNNTGSTIANGVPVYINGASSGLPTVALAKANALATSNVVGLSTESIANGATGNITVIGAVHGLNTSGFTAGSWVYLDAVTAGNLVSTAPSVPNFSQLVGVVVVSSATVGVIAVSPGSPTAMGTSTPTASTLVEWDANSNLSANNYFFDALTSTATAAGTLVLTVASDAIQVLTGTSTETVTLPTTGVPQSGQWMIVNQSTGNVTVQSSGANTVVILAGGTSAVFTAAVATPTTAANWECQYGGVTVVSGSVLTVNNTMSLSSFPGASFNFAGTPSINSTAVGPFGTTETQLSSYQLPASSVSSGQAFQFESFGTHNTTSGVMSYYVTIGTHNTSADSTVSSAVCNMAASGGSNWDGMLVIRTTGTTGTCIASMTGVGSTTVVASTSTTTTFNTTVSNFIGLYAKVSAGSHTCQQAFLSVCQV